MPAALRHFRVVILIQIGVERNERVIEKIALDPDPRRTRLGCRDSYLIDATGVPFQRQLPGLAGFGPIGVRHERLLLGSPNVLRARYTLRNTGTAQA